MHYRVKSTRKRMHYRVKRTRNKNRNRTRTVNRYRILRGGAVTAEEINATKAAVNKIFRGFEVKSKDLLSPSLKYNYLNLIKTVTRM